MPSSGNSESVGIRAGKGVRHRGREAEKKVGPIVFVLRLCLSSEVLKASCGGSRGRAPAKLSSVSGEVPPGLPGELIWGHWTHLVTASMWTR